MASRGAIVCDLGAAAADARTLEQLAHVALAARRRGCALRVRRVSPELRDLLDLAGLTGVLVVEPRREPEEREQPLGVEEEGELGDAGRR